MKEIKIGNKIIGPGHETFIIAEMSGNHNMDYSRAEKIIRAAKEAGVDAVKLQTYTADTITLNSNDPIFSTDPDGLWANQSLYELYQKAYTPWDWQPKLKKLADELGIMLFSSPFDVTAVDFLEKMDVPAYKIASYEMNDTQLIKKVAMTGKPIIMSTGISDIEDIDLAIKTCKSVGNDKIILLKCTSEYPAPFENMNLKMIPSLSETFNCVSGLSDHSMGDEVAIAAVTLGANVIEKHFTLDRADGGVDSAFSMDIKEMTNMVEHIRHVEKALGKVDYSLSEDAKKDRHFSRSLFISADIKKGEVFTYENVRSVRPNNGLPVKYLEQIIGKKATRDMSYATPLTLADVEWN